MSVRAADPADFTCLLPVHAGADPLLFEEAAQSIRRNTVQPAEVLVCQDGPTSEPLRGMIAAAGFDVVASRARLGLHHALNHALEHVRTPWVCRADSDDANRPDRFARQVRFLRRRPEVDVLGGAIEEHVTSGVKRVKRAPLSHAAILSRARWRNPVHHMTVFYRHADVRAVGGYPAIPFKEDYGLWLRLLAAGRCFANLADVLVDVRCVDLARRRAGLHNFASERALWLLRREREGGFAVRAAAVHAARAAVLALPPAAGLAYAGLRWR